MDGKIHIHVDENGFNIYHEIYNLPYRESFSYTITRNELQTGLYVLHYAKCEICKLCGDHGFIWFEDGIYTDVYDKVRCALLYKTFDEYIKDVISELAVQIPELQGKTIVNIYGNNINDERKYTIEVPIIKYVEDNNMNNKYVSISYSFNGCETINIEQTSECNDKDFGVIKKAVMDAINNSVKEFKTRKKKILFICGTSCTGKSTLVHDIFEDKNLNEKFNLHRVVTHTDRPIREGEVDGKEYIFHPSKFAIDTEDVFETEVYTVDDNSQPVYRYWTTFNDILDGCVNVVSGSVDKCVNYINTFGVNSVLPIFLYCDQDTALLRSIKREKNSKHPNYGEAIRRVEVYNKDTEYNTLSNAYRNYDILSIDTSTKKVKIDDIYMQLFNRFAYML